MKKARSFKELYTFALGYLARREHSTQELTQKLKTKLEPAHDKSDMMSDVILEVIQELTRKNYLSDRRFAESYSRMRVGRGYGKLRIQAELKDRGITGDLLNACFHQNNSDSVEESRIRQVREKKFGETLPGDMKEKSKQARYLQYRGFSFDEIKRALNNDHDE